MSKAAPYSDQKAWSNTYLTDPALIKALGPFGIDVACPPVMPWQTAKLMLHEDRFDGLTAVWPKGRRAWMNPPYRGVTKWAQRLVDHGSGIALLNGRSTETQATQLLMRNCTALFLPDGRLTFYKVDGTPWDGKWFPSLIIGMGQLDAAKLKSLPRRGFDGVFFKGPKYDTDV